MSGRLLAQAFSVLLRLEADQQLAAAKIEYWAFDHRGLRQHQRDGYLLCDAALVLIGQFLESRAGTVEQRLPAHLLRPAFQLCVFDAGGFVVVESIIDAVIVEPCTRLLHGVAVFDAVEGDGHNFNSASTGNEIQSTISAA